jgi:signal transduction protein with GAF and PtsI domain
MLFVRLSAMVGSNAYVCRLCGDIASAEDLVDTIKILAKNITKIMRVKGCSIRMLNEKNKTLEIVAAHGLSKQYLKKGPIALRDHPVDRTVLKGRIRSTMDITKEKHVLYVADAQKEGIKSVLSVPLIVENRPIGVVRIYTTKVQKFTKDEIDTLTAFANLGAILAEKSRLWNEMKVLMKISQSISSTLSLDKVLQMIVENVTNTLGMKASLIRLLDDGKKYLEIRAAYGLSDAYLQKGTIEVARSRVDRECLKCRVVEIKNVKKDKRLQYPDALIHEGIMALLSIPLTVRGAAIGVLRVYSPVPYAFQGSEIDFLSTIACQGAIAIENARLFEHVSNEYKELAKDVWKWYDWGTRFPKI